MIKVFDSVFLDENDLALITSQFEIMRLRPFPEDDIVRWPNLLRMMPHFVEIVSKPKTISTMTGIVGPDLATSTLSEYAFVRRREHNCLFSANPLKKSVCTQLPDLGLITVLSAVTPINLSFAPNAQEVVSLNAGQAMFYTGAPDFWVLPEPGGTDKQFLEFSFFSASKRITTQLETRLLNELNISRVLLNGENGGQICNYSIVWPGKTE